MNIISFIHLVELRTKVASVIPFLFGTTYALYAFDHFNLKNALLMFASMFIFDMTTTAINNYVDFIKAFKTDGYGYEVHNAIGKYKLKLGHVRLVIALMLGLSSLLGLLLFLNTNSVVLLLGMLSFTIGILYTFGPVPISRTPFGEVFSGLAMGFLLPFITIYIHVFDQDILTLTFGTTHLDITLNYQVLMGLLIVCIPFITTIANIMLANNICDMEEDLPNKRYTLPIFIGKENALTLWASLYYIGYLAIAIGVLLGILPWTSLFTLVTLFLVHKNIMSFKAKPLKGETFILAIKNFILIGLCYTLSILLGLLL